MKGRWKKVGNHLAIQCDNQIFHLDGGEVFSILSGRGQEFLGDIEYPDLEASFDGVDFSQIGSELKCVLANDEHNEISLSLCCFREDDMVPVDVIQGQIIDQCMTDKEWFYVSGNTEEVAKLFKELDIKDQGRINVSQYIKLIKAGEGLLNTTIINHVKSNLLDKPIGENKNLPDGLQASLYEYQKVGYFWMSYMLSENTGCVLADEMGLGKTLQVIAVILSYTHEKKVPMLVVAPVSLLQNWKRECEKFAPEIKVLIHHGSQRTGNYRSLENYDLVVTSYSAVVSDASLLKMIDWKLVILDEAQNIKNPDSARAKFVKKIPKEGCIAITGTPFENHMTDLWSLTDFVSPGLLGTKSEFETAFPDDQEGAEALEPIITPLMIRRLVKDVGSDLPEKIIISQPLEMSDIEAIRYEDYREQISNSCGENPTLATLQKLRMYCTHPLLCDAAENNNPAKNSIKYQRLIEIMEEIVASEEKVILFTSYQKMFDILTEDIPERFDIPVWTINGSTEVENRQDIVDLFNDYEGSALLALNPRAAGTGLNITAANHVIHYNLEWNPALEDQASARAYRRGQKKNVFVYRLFYENTVEQIVNERIEKKRDMSSVAIVGTDGTVENKADIINALKISPVKEK